MGMVFGSNGGVAEPSFAMLSRLGAANSGMEVRYYQAFCTASVPYDMARKRQDNGFRTLAKYIGVIGDPANVAPDGKAAEPIAMTAPVLITEEKKSEAIAMTAPVLTTEGAGGEGDQKGSMSFVMPFKYQKVSELPRPTIPEITLAQVPRKVMGVFQFNGSMDQAVGRERYSELRKELCDGKLIDDCGEEVKDGDFEIAQYNPPFTIPYFRRNEIWVQLDPSRPEVKALLDANGENEVVVA